MIDLRDIEQKVYSGERLSFEEGVRLFQLTDLCRIGKLADLARKRKAGDNVYYIANKHLYYTNVCIWQCDFCAFSETPGSSDAYTKTLDEIESEAKDNSVDLAEFRITGGINPDLPLDYYEEMLRRLKSRFPCVHIEAFAPTEIDFMASISKLDAKEVLIRLQQAGLGALCSGGAEIFSPRARARLCSRKTSGDNWIRIMEIAHELGIASNASMLYGHVETIEERVEHILRIRGLQDRTGGFNAFIPLPFLSENTALEHRSVTTGHDDLKVIAVSRLLLDNFEHIKVLWMFYGLKIAQTALAFGANDLGGTVREEQKGVARSAGSQADPLIQKQKLIRAIEDAGRIPVERGTLYEPKEKLSIK
jgi:aminodeoxyfutalosine synthase